MKINLSLVQCRYTRKHPLKLNIYYISTKQQLHKKEKSHARAPALHMPELPQTFQQHRGHPLFPLFKKNIFLLNFNSKSTRAPCLEQQGLIHFPPQGSPNNVPVWLPGARIKAFKTFKRFYQPIFIWDGNLYMQSTNIASTGDEIVLGSWQHASLSFLPAAGNSINKWWVSIGIKPLRSW